MKKKARAGNKQAKGAAPARKGTRKAVDLAEIRQQITHLVDGRDHDGRSGGKAITWE
jgi:hypothetical protein